MIKFITNFISKYRYKYLLKKFFYFYNKQAFTKAYDVLKEAAELRNLHNEGFLYVMYAELEFLAYDDVEKAREYLDEAYYTLGYDFSDSDYNLYGSVLYRAGEHDKGIEYLEKSVEMNPSIHYLRNYANVLSCADDKRADKIWERIIEEGGADLDVYIHLAEESFKSGKNEETLLLAKQAEELAHKPYDLFKCGRMYEDINQYQKALEIYKKCEKLDYASKNRLYYFIARCCYNINNLNDTICFAIKSLQFKFDYSIVKDLLLTAIEANDSELNLDQFIFEHDGTCLVYLILALINIKRKDYLKVGTYLLKAEQMNPCLEELFFIGKLNSQRKNFHKAIKIFKKCEQQNYRDKNYLYSSLAGCYLYLEEYISAMQYAAKSLRDDVDTEYAKDVLIYCLDNNKDDSICDSLLEKYQDTCFSYMLLTQKEISKKNFSKAREMLIKAEQLNPTPTEMYNISYLYYKLEDIQTALDRSFKAEKIGFDEKSRLYSALADCYYFLDDFDNAFKFAIKLLCHFGKLEKNKFIWKLDKSGGV